MAKVLLQTAPVSTLEVLSGPEKGSIIPFSGSPLTIGRGDDNDIVVPSESVSRNHAVLEKSADFVTVKDNESKNGVIVDGAKVTQAVLSGGEVVQVGDFVFRYHNVSVPAKSALEPFEPVPRSPKSRRLPVRSKRVVLFASLIGFVLIAFWLSSSEEKPKIDSTDETRPAAADSEKIASRPPTIAEPGMKQVEQEVSKFDWNDTGIRESEQYFRRGTREYLNRNFHRAIEAFQTAIQIEKDHPAAKKYLSWAVQEVEAEAKKNRDLGIRYFESLQYQRALFHFQQVISLMSHRPGDPMVNQAEKYIELSKRALEAADFFP